MTRQIEPKLLERLGLLVVRFALVEQTISDLFIHLTGGDPGAMVVVTSNSSQSSISNWTRTLLDIRSTPDEHELSNELREALTEADRLRGLRNDLVHGLWGTNCPPGSVCVQTVRLERNEIIKDLVVTASDLDDLIVDTEEVAAQLLSILKRAQEP